MIASLCFANRGLTASMMAEGVAYLYLICWLYPSFSTGSISAATAAILRYRAAFGFSLGMSVTPSFIGPSETVVLPLAARNERELGLDRRMSPAVRHFKVAQPTVGPEVFQLYGRAQIGRAS